MKRFIKSILLILFPVIVLSLLWIPSPSASPSKIDIRMDIEEGDPEIAELLSFGGYVSTYSEMSMNYETNYFRFHGGEIEIDDFSSDFEDPQIEEWIDEYPSFIRGKMHDSSVNFNETETFLFYAAMESETYYDQYSQGEIRFSVLDKETEEESSFLLENPELEIDSSYTDATVLNDSKIYLFSTSYNFNRADSEEELIVYEIDPDTVEENGVNDSLNVTRQIKGLSGDDSLFGIQFANYPEQDNPYVVFRTMVRDGEYGDIASGEYFLLNLNTFEIVETNLNAQLENAYILIEEDKIYVLDDAGEQMVLYSFDIESNELIEITTIDTTSSAIGRHTDNSIYSNWFNANQFIYENWIVLFESITFDDESDPKIQIFDIETGETVFSGQITISHQDESLLYEIGIYDVRLDGQ